ncbi:MAG: cysteine hydrolase [Chloroflexi bacterium]|nr:cysteine hydrolase [Chloroflexota bacterium]
MSALTIDKRHTAVLIMDYQRMIVDFVGNVQERDVLENARAVLEGARVAGLPVIYVLAAFRPGHPEVSAHNKRFTAIKKAGNLVEGAPGTEIHPEVAAQPGDIIVTKRRVGAFISSDLATVLKAAEIDTIVLMGLASSGVVLSTTRFAADSDYEIVILEDCCSDRDMEVHRVLMEKVFPTQATVTTSAEFLKAIGA